MSDITGNIPNNLPDNIPNEVIIRQAAVEDAAAIAAVHVKTWQAAYRGQIPDDFLDTMSVDVRTERWRRILANHAAQEWTFVAVENGTVVGFCSVGRCRDADADQTMGELYAIYVDPQTMSRGIGALLMGIGVQHLLEQGFEQATLWVLESNKRAQRFYSNKGWVADGLTRSETIGNAPIPEVRYAIHFAPTT